MGRHTECQTPMVDPITAPVDQADFRYLTIALPDCRVSSTVAKCQGTCRYSRMGHSISSPTWSMCITRVATCSTTFHGYVNENHNESEFVVKGKPSRVSVNYASKNDTNWSLSKGNTRLSFRHRQHGSDRR